MDILAARKKAAARANAQKNPEPAQTADARPVQAAPIEIPSHPAEPEPAQAATVAEAPPPESGAHAPEGRAGMTETSPAAESGDTQAQEIELLSFRIGGEEYAVRVADVREVMKVRGLTPVPNVPDYILGVTSLRGAMLPVLDLSKRLGLEAGDRGEKARILVVKAEEEDVGLMVDRVTGVFKISADDVKPVPENIEQGGELLRGIARKDERLYILLDLEKAVGS
jgi:purine-binding chemotaxis protein CheW